ncbi:hypothetical protein NLI96_g953 [Meripilus lineatus]|uniref:HpcH/HpaI aldolase/citrate lyase domain-containing protein n=1 Tax=Meripilus lineatus TaxID=2056292 RepID=A0AAD5VBE5_9APHY|nr:hypothetical protein NLI96_g953 [Physisporinus lineatus]
MLEKSLSTNSDVIIFDLEDSVPPAPASKQAARDRLEGFLRERSQLLQPERVAIRLNRHGTPFFSEDISLALRYPQIRTLVLPKIHSQGDLDEVSQFVNLHWKSNSRADTAPLDIVASVESAKAMFNLGAISSWTSECGLYGGRLSALLFAAEDYCADTGIIRTPSRRELLYTRSKVAITAKAFGLQAIDMVDFNIVSNASTSHTFHERRELGFTGKQAIHPAQVDTIHSTFVPTEKEILRAARILHNMEKAHASNRGAIGLSLEGGGQEMIDAPMIKQAGNVIRIAKQAGLTIPDIKE